MFEGLTPEEVRTLEAELAKLPPEQQGSARERLAAMRPEELKAMFKKVGPVCVFCKIAAKEIPAHTVYEDADVIAFLDINPANKGHVLVVPKKHVESFISLRDAEINRLMTAYREIAKAVVAATSAEGFNILENDGKVAGQVVPHVHMHIIPRFSGDELSFNWPPKKFSDEEYGELRKSISANLKSPERRAPTTKKKSALPKVKPRVPKY